MIEPIRQRPRAADLPLARLLLVEDEDSTREALSELLGDQGYEVVSARNGQRGLRLLETGLVPDVILLDLLMPVMDGWTMHNHLAAHGEWAKIPIIVISAVPVNDQARTPLRAVAHFPKPFHLRLLLETIADCCGQAKSAAKRRSVIGDDEADA